MRIVVADDSVLFREGLLRVLTELGHEVVAAVGEVQALYAAVDRCAPRLAVVDVRMPARPDGPATGAAGADAATQIRAGRHAPAVVLLSQHIELRTCAELLGTPGFGYLLKDRVLRLDEFDATLRRVASGGTAVDPDVVQALVRPRGTCVDRLTAREHQVLSLVAQGRSNASIAAGLRVSERTVEAHLRAVFAKLDLPDDGHSHRRVRAVITFLESR